MAVTFAADEPASIYINGVLEGTSVLNQAPIPNITQTFQIGARRSGSGAATNFWDGQIDDVAFWSGTLTPAQIESLAGVGAGGYAGRSAPTSIPEPTTGFLLGLCGLVASLSRRRSVQRGR